MMVKPDIQHPALHNTLLDDLQEEVVFNGNGPEHPNLWGPPTPLPFQEKELNLLLETLSQKKVRGPSAWLQEAIGWSGFLGILSLFLLLQIFMNGMLKGWANQLAIGLSIVLEIGLLWFWELYWY